MEPGPEPLPADPILKDGDVIGFLTSVSLGYRTGKLLALGYVERGALKMDEACKVQAFGVERDAMRHSHHVYDPQNLKLKA